MGFTSVQYFFKEYLLFNVARWLWPVSIQLIFQSSIYDKCILKKKKKTLDSKQYLDAELHCWPLEQPGQKYCRIGWTPAAPWQRGSGLVPCSVIGLDRAWDGHETLRWSVDASDGRGHWGDSCSVGTYLRSTSASLFTSGAWRARTRGWTGKQKYFITGLGCSVHICLLNNRKILYTAITH